MASYRLISVLLTTFLISAAVAIPWDDLRCTFSSIDYFRLDSFYKQPRKLAAAEDQGWTEPKEAEEEGEDGDLSTRCYKTDPTVCLLYDRKGSIAGYQISLPKDVDRLSIPGIEFRKIGFTEKVLFDKPHYTTRIFFESQEQIKSGGRRWDGKTGTGLWLPIGGTLQEIPLKEADLAEKQPLFRKQHCADKMGVHYFYNMSREAQPEDFQPFFILYSKGELVGWGLNVFGGNASKMSFQEYFTYFSNRHWFESAQSPSKLRTLAPAIPEWSHKYQDLFGIYSHHVYMVSNPWDITC